jgi:hypothetical protein
MKKTKPVPTAHRYPAWTEEMRVVFGLASMDWTPPQNVHVTIRGASFTWTANFRQPNGGITMLKTRTRRMNDGSHAIVSQAAEFKFALRGRAA